MEDKSSPSSLPLPVAGNSAKLDEKRNLKAEVKAQKGDTGNQLIVEQQGLCEEQVQNAVKFLLHPSVRGSSTVQRVSFLEKKGLSKEEIEEAFCRVSDSSPNVFSGAVAAVEAQLNGSLPPTKEETLMEGIQSTEKLSIPVMNLNGAHGYSGTSASKEDTAVQLVQAPLSGKLDGAPHSASYLKIMEMLEQGQTPPGIQDVDDKPPNPYQPPSVSHLQPRPKPWETIGPESGNSPSKLTTYNSRSHTESTIKSTTNNWRQEDDASLMQEIYTSSASSDAGKETANTAPWWRQKKEPEPHYVSKMEVVADSNGTGLRIPFWSGSESEGNFNGHSVDSQMSHPSWGPHPISHTAMPAATNYQNMEAKHETRPLSIVQGTPEISQFTDVEGPPSPVSSYAGQNFPSVDQKGESDNVLSLIPQSIQHSEGKETGFE